MEYLKFDNMTGKYAKSRYIDKSLQWLALRPQLLDGVKTDKELIGRVTQFAKVLCECDTDIDNPLV